MLIFPQGNEIHRRGHADYYGDPCTCQPFLSTELASGRRHQHRYYFLPLCHAVSSGLVRTPHNAIFPASQMVSDKTFEQKLYKKLRVKHWKDHMPTYAPASFSLQENTLEQIVDNCCVSEAVHEVIILFSFVPLIFAFWWGIFPVFLITSLLAAAIDGSFVIIQRYNRPRLVRILAKKEAIAHE